jgi:phospholipid-binding lipoprotein MlaA
VAAPAARIGDDEIELEFADEETGEPSSFPDPLEPLNRGTLAFNQIVDGLLLDPITDLYQLLLPHPVRKSVRNFLANLDSPAVLANDLLQREWSDAGVTVTRFGINTTVGIAGVFDPATSLGWDGHFSDFGQTLALEGVPSGPYIVLPILGPTTVRDGCGEIVDVLFRPVTFLLGPAGQIFYTTIYGGSSGLATRDVHAAELEMLEQSSVDFYAALRNAYFQTRTAEIWARRSSHDSLSELATGYYVWGDAAGEGERRVAAD